MRMAAAAPDRVEKLVLAASVSGDRLPTAPRLGIFRPYLPLMTRLSALSAWRRMFYDRSKLDLKTIRAAYVAPARIYGSLNTIWEMWKDTKGERPPDFSRLTMPVLILWAEKERIVPFARFALSRLRRRLPHATVERIPRTGHLLLEENPADANAAIRAFLGSPLASAEPLLVDV
jgi:pimeloyl-ACP methyl ester carboxylesterase